MRWWKRLKTWKKGALIGLIFGAIIFGSLINIYNYNRTSYERCYSSPEHYCIADSGEYIENWRENESHPTCTVSVNKNDLYKCDNINKKIYSLLQPFWNFYVEGYMTLAYYFLGLFAFGVFGENSIVLRIAIYFYYGLPPMIFGGLLGYYIQRKKK